MAAESFKKGDNVLVFYRMNKRCRPDRKYLAMLDQRQGAFRPRTGISDGWVPAQVVADQDPKVQGGAVRVEYSWPHFFTQRGQLADSSSGYSEWFQKDCVRKVEGPQTSLVTPGSQPTLALLTFRWGAVNEVVAPSQWGSTGSSNSDIFINSYLDRLEYYCAGDYEVWTVYIEDKSDIAKIADSAHLIFGSHHPMRRARHVCAMYHIYPTGFEEHCVPTSETGGDGGASLCEQKAYYRMMQAVERAGIPSRFPHDSGFYELLSSKRWTYYMSLVPHLRIPPTVALPRMLIESGGCAKAAEWAHKALRGVRQQQQKLRGEAVEDCQIPKGVAKLGFSYEALDVKFWEGTTGLETAIYQLTQAIEISDELTGQPHDLENIIVQEYVKHDIEMRLYVVDGEVESVIYTKFCKIKPNNEFGDFQESFELKDAAKKWCGGDVAALEDGLKQAREITAHWIEWVKAQTCAVPAGIRFDYFMGRADTPGKAIVWTLEICELGFSMLGDEALPVKVFDALLRSCLGGELPQASGKPQASQPQQSQQFVPPARSAPQEPAKQEGASSSVPTELYITVQRVPGGTEDQVQCTGKYELVAGTDANKRPLWMHSRGDRFLYFGIDGHWYVGDEEEQDQNFQTDSGYIRHAAGAQGTLPHQLKGPWERGPDWDQDPGILVTDDPEAKPERNSKGKGKKEK